MDPAMFCVNLLGYAVGFFLGLLLYLKSFLVFFVCTTIVVLFDLVLIVSCMRALRFYRTADPRLENTLMFKYLVDDKEDASAYVFCLFGLLIPYLPVIFFASALVVLAARKVIDKIVKLPNNYFRKLESEREENLQKVHK